jgi:hypothetical protein
MNVSMWLIAINCIFCVLMILIGDYNVAAINFLTIIALALTLCDELK